MESLDTDLQRIRFSGSVLELLRSAAVTDVKGLMNLEPLLAEVRTHLNPIQHTKLNSLIKKHNQNDRACEESVDVKYKRKDLVRERNFTQQCLDDLNTLSDAPEPVTRWIYILERRVEHLSSLLGLAKSSEKNEADTQSEEEKDHVPVEKEEDSVTAVDSDLLDDIGNKQQRLYQWRMDLMCRLANVCKFSAAYNRNVERTLQRRQQWIQDRTMFDMRIMMSSTAFTSRERADILRRHKKENDAISMNEKTLKTNAENICTNLMDWTTEANRINMALIENPYLDASSVVEAVVMFKQFREDTIVVVTQQSRYRLVVPGECCESYLDRVMDGQSGAGR